MKGLSAPGSTIAFAALLFLLNVFSSTSTSIPKDEHEGNIQQQALLRLPRSLGSKMNKAEIRFCARPRNWKRCLAVKNHTFEASREAARRFPNSQINGNGDAFRHCYWSARMTRDLGEKQAKGFGDRHEQTIQNEDALLMDLFNNAVGRSVGQLPGSYENDIQECFRRVYTGRLIIIERGYRVPSGIPKPPPVQDLPTMLRSLPGIPRILW